MSFVVVTNGPIDQPRQILGERNTITCNTIYERKRSVFDPFILLIRLTECRITKENTPIKCIHTQNPGGGAKIP